MELSHQLDLKAPSLDGAISQPLQGDARVVPGDGNVGTAVQDFDSADIRPLQAARLSRKGPQDIRSPDFLFPAGTDIKRLHRCGIGDRAFFHGWRRMLAYRRADIVLYLLKLVSLSFGAKGNRKPLFPSSAGAANPMNVVFLVCRELVIDDSVQPADIQSPRRHIRRDQ